MYYCLTSVRAMYHYLTSVRAMYRCLTMIPLTHHHYHHHPINFPTAGAQAFRMDYPQGERAIAHHAAQCGFVGANDLKCSRNQRLNVPTEARRSSR
jgi:hypothetical protein